ncbi:MAG: hypothetical protein HQ501_10140 [Rhodospirillales bacterium]|nr:hypothetical protein [Rhodospirillales bacterium]
MPKSSSELCISEEDTRMLAEIAGVHDPETVNSLHQWMMQEVPNARKTPDLADQLQGDAEAARKELQPLTKIAKEFLNVIRNAPHALERVRMLYAEEPKEPSTAAPNTVEQRRLDQDMKGLARLAAAIEATDAQALSESRAGPALLGPRKAARVLAEKYMEISYQPFHYYVPDIENIGNIWSHPHTSPGTRFVATALKTMFPTLNDTNLRNIMKELPQFTNRSNKRE